MYKNIKNAKDKIRKATCQNVFYISYRKYKKIKSTKIIYKTKHRYYEKLFKLKKWRWLQ